MEPIHLPSREEIHAAFEQGEGAVIALIAGLVSNWMAVLQEQQEITQPLEERVKTLEN